MLLLLAGTVELLANDVAFPPDAEGSSLPRSASCTGEDSPYRTLYTRYSAGLPFCVF